MSVALVKTFDEPAYDYKEILRYANCKEADENVSNLICECIAELKDKLSYKVCYAFVDKNENSLSFSSDTLDKYLINCKSFIIFAATIGIEIDRLIMKYSRISPAKAHIFQAIGAERIEALCDAFQNEFNGKNKNIKPRVSPGYGDIPLGLQTEIFSLLDCPRKIGLSLNKSMLMSPTKSVTAFIGVIE